MLDQERFKIFFSKGGVENIESEQLMRGKIESMDQVPEISWLLALKIMTSVVNRGNSNSSPNCSLHFLG